jgi:archaellum biogenesis ATPase FlaH
MRDEYLSKYGYDFQCKLIAALLVDSNFISQSLDVIKPKYFESAAFEWIIDSILTYYNSYKTSPNLEFFKVKLADIEDVTLKVEIKSILRDSAKSSDSQDLEFIKETTFTFCSNQALKQAILDSVDYIKAGKPELIRKTIDSALNIGVVTDLGIDYETDESIDFRYSGIVRNPIPTGWEPINELTKGGLGPGELGIVVGATGAGKSWFLMHIGAAAVNAGKKVLHITLELDAAYTALRYDSIFTGTAAVNLNAEIVRNVVEQLPGKLKVKWFPTASLTMSSLKAYINKIKISDFGKPDLLIIDYLDIMKLPAMDANHLALTRHYEDARGLAGEEQIPVWSCSQGNKESYNSDVLEADKVAGAYGKIFTADFAMSLSRRAADKLNNTARAHIIKNRFGPDGLTLPVKIDTYRGIIEIYKESSKAGEGVKQTMMSESEFNRLSLRNKYNSLNNKVNF